MAETDGKPNMVEEDRKIDLAIKRLHRDLANQYDMRLEKAEKDASKARSEVQDARDDAASARAGMKIVEERLTKTLEDKAVEIGRVSEKARNDVEEALRTVNDLWKGIEGSRGEINRIESEIRESMDKSNTESSQNDIAIQERLQKSFDERISELKKALTHLSLSLEDRISPLEKTAEKHGTDITQGLIVLRNEMVERVNTAISKSEEAMKAVRESREHETPKSEQLASMSKRLDSMNVAIDEMRETIDSVESQENPIMVQVEGLKNEISDLRQQVQSFNDNRDRLIDEGLKRLEENDLSANRALRDEILDRMDKGDNRVTELFATLDAQMKDSSAIIGKMKDDLRMIHQSIESESLVEAK